MSFLSVLLLRAARSYAHHAIGACTLMAMPSQEKRIEKSFDCRCCRNFRIYFLNYLVRYSFAIHHFTVGESQVRVKTDLFIALSVSYSVILSASVGDCRMVWIIIQSKKSSFSNQPVRQAKFYHCFVSCSMKSRTFRCRSRCIKRQKSKPLHPVVIKKS